MRLIFLYFFLLSFVYSLLFSERHESFIPPEEPFVSSLVRTQEMLSTAIESVSVISGEWMQSETDFIVLGPEPLILSRNYVGDHAHNSRLGYNWDFNQPHKLIVDMEDKKKGHAKARARLHHSSGIATIHESTMLAKDLDRETIPMRLSRMKGLTNCRGEMSAKTNLHNTLLHLDWSGKRCISMTGSGLVT